MQKSKNILLLFLVGFILMACQNVTRPSGVLSADDFEDVLYDIHLSHYVDYSKKSGDTLSVEAHRYALTLDVLKKHDVTKAEWDSSMVYYTRHATELKKIYDDLFDRMSYVAEGLGASVGEGSADSTDIWKAERQLMLTSRRGYTTMQWKINADTLLKAGEKINMQYLCLFLNPQSQCRMMSVITIRLNNDSVIVRNQVSSQSGIYTITIEDDQKLGIRSVSGYFMVMRSQNDMFRNPGDNSQQAATAAQIVSVSDIRLTHQLPKPVEQPAGNNANDTINANSGGPSGAPTPPPPPGNDMIKVSEEDRQMPPANVSQ